MEENTVHKRRVRYKGTHPRTFAEKYKEHDPEKYKDEIQKIIDKGNTPAGMHISIMVNEILNVLDIKPGEIGYDATLGYGGHTLKMLEKLCGSGHMYATDVDPIESVKTKARLEEKGFGEEILTIRHMNFADIDKVAPGVKFDFVLADLGVSSMQIDDPERGFTFRQDGPLDLRMDPTKGEPASVRLKGLSQDELENLLIENSDEPYADRIAKEVVHTLRKNGMIKTTGELHDAIARALKFLPESEYDEAVRKSSQRTFQALRIDVNSEFEVLEEFLNKLPSCMAPGGRIAILTFHSGEDRLVKKAFKSGEKSGVYSEVSKDVIRPSKEECYRNPRAHSTKLRYAVVSDQ